MRSQSAAQLALINTQILLRAYATRILNSIIRHYALSGNSSFLYHLLFLLPAKKFFSTFAQFWGTNGNIRHCPLIWKQVCSLRVTSSFAIVWPVIVNGVAADSDVTETTGSSRDEARGGLDGQRPASCLSALSQHLRDRHVVTGSPRAVQLAQRSGWLLLRKSISTIAD
jgi:hypothetical protein